MDILQFSARVLVAQATGCQRAVTLLPDRFCPCSRLTCGQVSCVGRRAHGQRRIRPWNESHAAASTDGHVAHDADRLAFPHSVTAVRRLVDFYV